MPKEKEFVSWDKKGPIAAKLVEQFDLHRSTNGAAGIDPSYTKPRLIRQEVRDKNEFLQQLDPAYFHKHYRSTVNTWRLARNLERAREGELFYNSY